MSCVFFSRFFFPMRHSRRRRPIGFDRQKKDDDMNVNKLPHHRLASWRRLCLSVRLVKVCVRGWGVRRWNMATLLIDYKRRRRKNNICFGTFTTPLAPSLGQNFFKIVFYLIRDFSGMFTSFLPLVFLPLFVTFPTPSLLRAPIQSHVI